MFKIEIEQTITRTIKKSDWKRVKENADGSSEMGWTPPIEKKEKKQIVVYSQQVEKLDLVAVINAVNGIK